MHTSTAHSLVMALTLAPSAALAAPAIAASKAELESSSKSALSKLIATVPAAKALSAKPVAVLVFPSITKTGFIVGGQCGYAMFFMRQKALDALNTAEGFEVGVGPSVVVMDEGMGKSTTTNTMQDDVYAFIFSQKGLMAGLGIQGNKITKLDK